jgi:hypothetical protein
MGESDQRKKLMIQIVFDSVFADDQKKKKEKENLPYLSDSNYK